MPLNRAIENTAGRGRNWLVHRNNKRDLIGYLGYLTGAIPKMPKNTTGYVNKRTEIGLATYLDKEVKSNDETKGGK